MIEKIRYRTSSDQKLFTKNQIKKQSKEVKIDIMRTWFFEHYENPANSCPPGSQEGGYQYIWGGPYDAKEELSNEFSDFIDEDIISELASDLDDEAFEWSAIPLDIDIKFYFELLQKIDTFKEFENSLTEVSELMKVKTRKSLREKLYKLLYANIITSIETYLSYTIIKLIINDRSAFQHIMLKPKNNKTLYRKKNKINNILDEKDKNLALESFIDLIHNIIWHTFIIPEEIYHISFGFKLDNYAEYFKDEISNRHHIVHRNGKNKEGKIIELDKDQLNDLIIKSRKFVTHLHKSVEKSLRPLTF